MGSPDLAHAILILRSQRELQDSELAALYGVSTKRFNEQVRRNRKRFPADFLFQLTAEESSSLRSQSATLKAGRGRHRKYLPYVFTEQGVAMLSTVLNSKRAIGVNIAIMRTFVRLRQILATHKELAERLTAMEKSTTSSLRRCLISSGSSWNLRQNRQSARWDS